MEVKHSGFYIETGKRNQNLLLEWSKMDALSTEFSEKMASLADLGIDSFRRVELDFLSAYPHAFKEDPNLSAFVGLKGIELENSMDAKLGQIFRKKSQPENLNESFRSLMASASYYIVTIREETSEKIQGFVTFLKGGPVQQNELKVTVLAVDKGIRREGLAGHLINSVKKIGIKPKNIFVSTRPSNSIAINAYKKWGFVEDFEAQKSPYLIKGHWVHFVRIENDYL